MARYIIKKIVQNNVDEFDEKLRLSAEFNGCFCEFFRVFYKGVLSGVNYKSNTVKK